MPGAALILLDHETRVIRWPREAEVMTGIASEKALGQPICALLNASGCNGEWGDIARACADEGVARRSAFAAGAPDRALKVDVHDIGRDDSDGGTAFVAQITDADDALELQRMAEATAELGHWRLDLATQRVYWSEGAYRVHGFPIGSQIPLDSALDVYAPDDRGAIQKALETAISERKPYSLHASLCRTDGAWRRVLIQGRPQLSPQTGEPVALFGVVRDVTAETEATRRLIRARDEANAAAEANMMLLATMSHEIRTPLNGILSMLHMLREDIEPSLRERMLDSVEDASQALFTVLNDVLDHSKIEAGNLTIESEPFDFSAVARTVIELFRPAAGKQGLRLEAYLPETAPVIGDSVRIQQILSNFISNAVKFTSSGSVELSLRDEGDAGFLAEVIDTGIGIPNDKLKMLFIPFHQADASTTRRFGGSGLGLAICKRLAEAMGGSVGAESDPGKGSRFWLRVALSKPESGIVARTDRAAKSLILRGRSPAILIVDDTETNRLIVQARLEALGAETDVAANGLEGLEKLSSGSFDAIVMDGAMPILNGPETARLIRMMPHPFGSVPIIGFTSYSKAEAEEGMAAAGMDGMLEKPLQDDVMIATLIPLIDHYNRREGASLSSDGDRDAAMRLADAISCGDVAAIHGAVIDLRSGDQLREYADFVESLIDRFGLAQVQWLAALTRRLLAEEERGDGSR